MRKVMLVAAALCAFAVPATSQIPAPRIDITTPQSPARAPSMADVQVAHIDDLGKPMDLKSNVYLPAVKGAATPLILYIHGKGGSYKITGDRVAQMVTGLTEKGFAVATIDYRM